MFKNLRTVLRVSAGMVILMLGIIGLFLPILQGWLFIFIAIPLISPKHGKIMVAKLKTWKEKIVARFKKKDSGIRRGSRET